VRGSFSLSRSRVVAAVVILASSVAGSLLAVDLADIAPPKSRVRVAKKPGKPFRELPTVTLADLPAIPLDGTRRRDHAPDPSSTGPATFFRVERRNGRWWLVDPTGDSFICRGVNSVAPYSSRRGRQALAERFGTSSDWATGTSRWLRDAGFNCLGAWSDESIRTVDQPLPYVRLWNFMVFYGKKRGGTVMKAGHFSYPGDCPFVFDPEFPAFCDEHARQLVQSRDDPWLVGHFSDNELPWKRSLLDNCLKLPQANPGHRAARAWLERRRGSPAADARITDKDRAGFLEHSIERYLAIVSSAIRRHDPHHLFLGMRLHGEALRLPEVFRACGRYCDVVSVNYYGAWTPAADRMAMWEREAGKPFLVSEFYAKGVDSGMPNTSGAGWLVETQRDRGLFYQNFTLALLASRSCVGWYWHRYADNDSDGHRADPSNRDSNKGIVSCRYEPWQPLVNEMTAINRRVEGIVDWIDRMFHTEVMR